MRLKSTIYQPQHRVEKKRSKGTIQTFICLIRLKRDPKASIRSPAHLTKSWQQSNGADADSTGSEEEWVNTSGSGEEMDPEDEAGEASEAAAGQDSPHSSPEKLFMDDTKIIYFY